MPAIKNNNTIAEYDVIIKVVRYYIQGLRTENIVVLKQAFHYEGINAVLHKTETIAVI